MLQEPTFLEQSKCLQLLIESVKAAQNLTTIPLQPRDERPSEHLKSLSPCSRTYSHSSGFKLVSLRLTDENNTGHHVT